MSTKQTDRFTLTDQERSSALWLRLKSYQEKRLQSMRTRNDGPLTNDDTLLLRGRIHEIKAFLSINEAMPIGTRKESQ
jgi:hypothetical protein